MKRAKTTNKGKDPFKGAPTVNINADYHFTDAEKQALGFTLAGLTQKKEEIAGHKKEVMAQINAQSEEVTAQIKQVSNKLRSGFEVRATDAFVTFDPKAGQKTFWRKDTGDEIRKEPMLPSDYEQELPMPGLPASQKPPEEPKTKKPKTSKKPEGGEGVTSFADALSAAAAGIELPRVPVFLPDDDSAAMTRAFKTAAKKAEWPAACIALIVEEAKKRDTIPGMLEVYNAHTEAPATE